MSLDLALSISNNLNLILSFTCNSSPPFFFICLAGQITAIVLLPSIFISPVPLSFLITRPSKISPTLIFFRNSRLKFSVFCLSSILLFFFLIVLLKFSLIFFCKGSIKITFTNVS